MHASMIINNGSVKHFHQCTGKDCIVNPDLQIVTFYSDQHAIDSGWVYTTDIRFCEPNQSTAWVCPECVKDIP